MPGFYCRRRLNGEEKRSALGHQKLVSTPVRRASEWPRITTIHSHLMCGMVDPLALAASWYLESMTSTSSRRPHHRRRRPHREDLVLIGDALMIRLDGASMAGHHDACQLWDPRRGRGVDHAIPGHARREDCARHGPIDHSIRADASLGNAFESRLEFSRATQNRIFRPLRN